MFKKKSCVKNLIQKTKKKCINVLSEITIINIDFYKKKNIK